MSFNNVQSFNDLEWLELHKHIMLMKTIYAQNNQNIQAYRKIEVKCPSGNNGFQALDPTFQTQILTYTLHWHKVPSTNLIIFYKRISVPILYILRKPSRSAGGRAGGHDNFMHTCGLCDPNAYMGYRGHWETAGACGEEGCTSFATSIRSYSEGAGGRTYCSQLIIRVRSVRATNANRLEFLFIYSE